MDRVTFPRQDAKVVPSQSEEDHQRRDDALPVGSHQSYPLQQSTKPPPKHKEGTKKEQPGEQQVSNPYEQPFTLEAALSLSLEDQTVPWYLQGYDLFMETRTSKYQTHAHTSKNQSKRKIYIYIPPTHLLRYAPCFSSLV